MYNAARDWLLNIISHCLLIFILQYKAQFLYIERTFNTLYVIVMESFYPFLSYKQAQVLHFLKDIFDLEKVCYSNVEILTEDILQSLQHRIELIETYLERDSQKPVYVPSHIYQPPKPFLA